MDDLLKNIAPPPSSSSDDVWRDIVVSPNNNDNPSDEMTLEDFLFKGSSDPPLDVIPPHVVPNDPALQPPVLMTALAPASQLRRKRRAGAAAAASAGLPVAVEESPVVDKATQQKQRRMIKNRESAARSRERKQAYTAELESLVTKLEEENAQLLQEEAELKKERLKQLMKNIIPVVECRRPRRDLMRASSMEW
ncbi:hypothetical protein MLD38_022885 [Melastoma candidum]|uniref:Uncharacterized protein n=1 Tax=Melastoma candidum TaxID=119954 RepID=A0ACB9QPQ9_9MYRT|nr:hypothetical protein MLD38_022885 [Melastoma candidum]